VLHERGRVSRWRRRRGVGQRGDPGDGGVTAVEFEAAGQGVGDGRGGLPRILAGAVVGVLELLLLLLLLLLVVVVVVAVLCVFLRRYSFLLRVRVSRLLRLLPYNPSLQPDCFGDMGSTRLNVPSYQEVYKNL